MSKAHGAGVHAHTLATFLASDQVALLFRLQKSWYYSNLCLAACQVCRCLTGWVELDSQMLVSQLCSVQVGIGHWPWFLCRSSNAMSIRIPSAICSDVTIHLGLREFGAHVVTALT